MGVTEPRGTGLSQPSFQRGDGVQRVFRESCALQMDTQKSKAEGEVPGISNNTFIPYFLQKAMPV